MTAEVFVLLLATNAVSLMVSTLYYISRVDDLHRRQQTLIQQVNEEYRMQARLMAQVRVEDLIGMAEASPDPGELQTVESLEWL